MANKRRCLRFDSRLSVEEAEELGFCRMCKFYLCMLLEGGGPSPEEIKRMEREEREREGMLA